MKFKVPATLILAATAIAYTSSFQNPVLGKNEAIEYGALYAFTGPPRDNRAQVKWINVDGTLALNLASDGQHTAAAAIIAFAPLIPGPEIGSISFEFKKSTGPTVVNPILRVELDDPRPHAPAEFSYLTFQTDQMTLTPADNGFSKAVVSISPEAFVRRVAVVLRNGSSLAHVLTVKNFTASGRPTSKFDMGTPENRQDPIYLFP